MFRKKRFNEEGAAAVEFALVVPVLLMLVFGIVDYSIAFNYRTQLNNAAIQGARHYVLTSNSTETLAVINDSLPASGKVTSSQVQVQLLTNDVASTGQCPTAWAASPRRAIRVQLTVSGKPSTTGMFGPFNFSGRGVAACR